MEHTSKWGSSSPSDLPQEETAAEESPEKVAPPQSAHRQLLLKVLPLLLWLFVSLATLTVVSLALTPEDGRALAILVFAVVGWGARPAGASMEYTSIAFLTFLTVSGAVSWDAAWGGLASEGIWLVFSGMAMSNALTETSICDRLAATICSGQPSWPGLMFRLQLIAAVLALTVPSQVVRCQLVIPIARGVIEHRGIKPLSRSAAAVVTSLVICTNHCGGAVLTGSLPNVIAAGALKQCDLNMPWGFWFFRMAPTFGAVNWLANIAVVLLLLPSEEHTEVVDKDAPPLGRLSVHERVVLGVFATTLALWATDLLHGAQPVTIGLLAVLLLYGPAIGPLPFETLRRLNFPILIFAGSVIAMAPTLSSAPSAGQWLGEATRKLVDGVDGSAWRHGLLFLTGLPLLMLTNVCVPVGVVVPELCPGRELDGSGVDARLGAMLLASIGNCTVLPFQNAPFLIAMSLSKDVMREKHFVVFLAANAVATLLIVLPATLAWWAVLGWST